MAASHIVEFKTKNNIPKLRLEPGTKKVQFRSRVLIKMPADLTPLTLEQITESLQVKDMTGKMTKPKIYLLTDDDVDPKYQSKVQKAGRLNKLCEL